MQDETYHLEAYLSYVQHQSFALLCSSEVAFLDWLDNKKIIFKISNQSGPNYLRWNGRMRIGGQIFVLEGGRVHSYSIIPSHRHGAVIYEGHDDVQNRKGYNDT